jgi:hypothetical protein
MAKRIAALAIAVLALGLVAAGCGGDDDETTSSTTSSSTTSGTSGTSGASGAADASPEHAAFIKEADAICKAGDDEIDAAAQELYGGQEPSQADQEKFIQDEVVPNIQNQLDQLSELDPPAEDAEEFQQIVDGAQSALDEISKDPSGYIESQGAESPFEDVNAQAQAFGLTSCGGD